MNTLIVSPELHRELIPLSDGRLGLRRGLQLELQNVGPDAASPYASPPSLDFIASNQALDRYGEIIMADGWRLENYRRNPVFQNAHQYGDVLFTLGKALVTEVRELAGGPALFQRIEFAVEVNPMARIAYGLYQGRFLNAVSVGFIPLRWEEPRENGRVGDSALRQNGGVGDSALPRRRFLEQELLEVSAVGIPANPEALQLGLKAGAIVKADLRDLLDLLGRFAGAQSAAECGRPRPQQAANADAGLYTPAAFPANSLAVPETGTLRLPGGALPIFSDTAASNTLACAPGVRSDGAQLLQLARALRDLLRRT